MYFLCLVQEYFIQRMTLLKHTIIWQKRLTESVHSAKEFSITSMTGSYRRVFQRPIDFVWELLTYIDGDAPLAETDMDTLSKSRPEALIKAAGGTDGNCCNQAEVREIEKLSLVADCLSANGGSLPNNEYVEKSDAHTPKVALKLGFTLPASCYATMAVRELLKNSTLVAYQKTMNQSAECQP